MLFAKEHQVTTSDTLSLINVAKGQETADLVVVGGTLLNVYTGELLPGQDVAIKGERIAYVGPDAKHTIGSVTTVIDARDKTLIPGLIDGHSHLTDLVSISEYLRYIAPGGTTAIFTETESSIFAMADEGLSIFLDSCRNQPIKVYALASVCPFIGPDLERGSYIPLDRLGQALRQPEVAGIGEAYWPTVVDGEEATLAILDTCHSLGKPVEGHSAGAKGSKLVAYVASGVSSCHEPIFANEVLERLRLGLHVMMRHGAIRQDLLTLAPIKDQNIDFRRLALATDGVSLPALIKHGYIDDALRQAIGLGFDPIKAIQMVTLNVAEHFRLDHDIGGIAPGRYADILIIPDVRTIRPEYVISNGQVVARNGQVLIQPKRYRYPEAARHTIRIDRRFAATDFRVPVPEDYRNNGQTEAYSVTKPVSIRVPAVGNGNIITANERIDLTPRDGVLVSDLTADILKMAVINRLDSGRVFVGFARGFGLKAGAVATSVTFCGNHLAVVGTNDEDIACALNRIVELQGGFVLCREGQVIEEIPLPIFGTVSDLSAEEAAEKMLSLTQAIQSLGSDLDNPLLSLQTITFTALPYLRVTDSGLIDIKTKEQVGLFVV